MIDKSQWPSKLRYADLAKLTGLAKTTIARRSKIGELVRHQDEGGYFWLRDEITDHAIREPQKAPTCECGSKMEAKSSDYKRGISYYRCYDKSCGKRIGVNRQTGERYEVRGIERCEHKCPACGGKLSVTSKQHGSQYCKCKGCAATWRYHVETATIVKCGTEYKTLPPCDKCGGVIKHKGTAKRAAGLIARYACTSCDNSYKVNRTTGERLETQANGRPAAKEPKVKVVKPKVVKPKQEKAKVAKSPSGNAREAREAIQRKNVQGLVQPVVDKAAAARRAELREKQYQAELRKIEREHAGW